MKKLHKLMASLAAAAVLAASCCIIACAASSPDEAVLSHADQNLTPLYTTSADSSEQSSAFSDSLEDGCLFYTQTTFLALAAGYLILFKTRGIDHSQKMHRRGKSGSKD